LDQHADASLSARALAKVFANASRHIRVIATTNGGGFEARAILSITKIRGAKALSHWIAP